METGFQRICGRGGLKAIDTRASDALGFVW